MHSHAYFGYSKASTITIRYFNVRFRFRCLKSIRIQYMLAALFSEDYELPLQSPYDKLQSRRILSERLTLQTVRHTATKQVSRMAFLWTCLLTLVPFHLTNEDLFPNPLDKHTCVASCIKQSVSNWQQKASSWQLANYRGKVCALNWPESGAFQTLLPSKVPV